MGDGADDGAASSDSDKKRIIRRAADYAVHDRSWPISLGDGADTLPFRVLGTQWALWLRKKVRQNVAKPRVDRVAAAAEAGVR